MLMFVLVFLHSREEAQTTNGRVSGPHKETEV